MELFVYIISDTDGVGITQLSRNAMEKFNVTYKENLYINIHDENALRNILEDVGKDRGLKIIFNSLNNPGHNKALKEFCKDYSILSIDFTSYSLNKISNYLGINPSNEEYLEDDKMFHSSKRIDAIDFAIKYDDGKDFRGLEYCDICIVGVSRSSKTPLSVYLASIGYKVSNVPLVLNSKVPKELFEIDSRKIFGLTMDYNRLAQIREARLNVMHLSKSSTYSDEEYIKKELAYAEEIMRDLDCKIIDVTNQSIEETSDYIISNIEKVINWKEIIWLINLFIILMKVTRKWEPYLVVRVLTWLKWPI